MSFLSRKILRSAMAAAGRRTTLRASPLVAIGVSGRQCRVMGPARAYSAITKPPKYGLSSKILYGRLMSTRVQALSDEERTRLAEELPGWRTVEGRDAIAKSFLFQDFNEAWGFMSRVALIAEKR